MHYQLMGKYTNLSDFSYFCVIIHKDMKYLIRAVKYFFYFGILTTAIIYALVLIGAVEGNIEAIFEGGYDALWKIALFYAAVAAVYPNLAFIKREIPLKGQLSDYQPAIIEFMKERRYELESSNDTTLTFRIRGTAGRLAKMYEDRITITSSFGGIQMEGLRKDVLRLATGLESSLNQEEN